MLLHFRILSRFKNIISQEGIYGLFFRVKARVYFIIYIICKLLNLKIVPSAYGYNFHANYSDSTFQLYTTGGYASYYWRRIKKINYNFIFLDIGANSGLYSISALKNKFLYKCYAFEPVLKTVENLKNNFILNKCKDNYLIVSKGISNFNGQVDINIDPNDSGRSNLRNKPATSIVDLNKSRINCINGNDLNDIVVNKKNIPIIIKIDVEGHEIIVLKELFNSNLKNYIKEFFLEINERWVDKEIILTILKKEGFSKIEKIGSDNFHYDIIAKK